MELTNYGFYMNTVSMLEIQNKVHHFAVFLISRHQAMFDTFKAKLAGILELDVEYNSAELHERACYLWRTQLAGQPSVLDQKFTHAELDIGFKLYLYPGCCSKRTYGFCATFHDEWYHEWLGQHGVAEYMFDTSDACQMTLGIEEWDRRRAVWKDLIQDLEQPRLFAFVIDPVRYGSPVTDLDRT